MSVDAWEMAADCPSHRSLQGPTTPCCAGNLQKLWIALGNKEQLKIVRLLIAEIVIDVADDTLALVIHW